MLADLLLIKSNNSCDFSVGNILKYILATLKSGLTRTFVVVTNVPGIVCVIPKKISLISFCISLAILFCLVASIIFYKGISFQLKNKISYARRYLLTLTHKSQTITQI